MAKHIARIVVTVLILGAIGYASWAFFFKPNNDEYVYSEILNVKEFVLSEEDETQTKLEEKLASLEEANYFGNISQIAFEAGEQDSVINMRQFLLNLSSANYANYYGASPSYFDLEADATFAEEAFYDLAVFSNYETILTEAMDYYLPYTQFVSGVYDEEIDLFKDYVEAYQNKYNKVLDQIDVILSYQSSITTVNTTVNTVLKGYYESLLTKYADYYVAYTDLIDFLRVFVTENTTEDVFVYDLQAVYFNSIVESIAYYADTVNFDSASFESETLSAAEIALNSYLVESLMYRENLAVALDNLSDASSFELVNVYNLLSQNYNAILFGSTNVFTYNNATKINVLNGEANAIASIRVENLENVQLLLEKLGFPAPVAEDPEETDGGTDGGSGGTPDDTPPDLDEPGIVDLIEA